MPHRGAQIPPQAIPPQATRLPRRRRSGFQNLLQARLSPEPKLNVTNTDPVAFGKAGVSGQTGATIKEVQGKKVSDRDKEGMIRKGMAVHTQNRSGHTDGGT